MPFVWLDATLVGVFGLLVGSFLNVVIYRLPIMLEAQWKADCREMLADGNPCNGEPHHQTEQAPKFNLMVPRSRCSGCGHTIAWWENIPVLSYLALRGKCSACGTHFGIRYPLIELVTGAAFFFCAARWGISAASLAWCGFSAALIALTVIDWDTTLLPDDITLPLLWAGLIVAALGIHPGLRLGDALWGAVLGYLSLWTIYWAFKLITHKEGMGYGDFKLLAALGAWFGWQALIPIVLLSSVVGAVVGLGMKYTTGLREGGYVPFGPFLAGAGFIVLIVGTELILNVLGL